MIWIWKRPGKLVVKNDAVIALNTELQDLRREKDELNTEKNELNIQLSNQSAQYDLDLEKANEELRKSSKETDMMRAMDERQQEMAEASFFDEKRKLSELVKRLRQERDVHFQDLTRCRKELRSIESELEKKHNRALALEEQGSSIRHVITDMRLEMEKMRKKFKRELDKKVEELARYKQKDIEMKRSLASLRAEKDEATLNESFGSSDLHRELREAKRKLSRLSIEREHLMDINNCLKSDLNKVIHTAYTPIRGDEYTPLSKVSPWVGSTQGKTLSPPTLKRTRLKERLNEIK